MLVKVQRSAGEKVEGLIPFTFAGDLDLKKFKTNQNKLRYIGKYKAFKI